MSALSDWYDANLKDKVDNAYSSFEDFAGSSAGGAILAYLMKDLTDTDVTRAGFQGKVEDRTAVQSRVADTADPFRRPGSSGRRYFSDVEFVKDKDDNVAQAKARTDAQAEALRIENRDNPYGPVATAYRLQQATPNATYDTTARATNRGIFSGYNPYSETAGVGVGLGALPFADPAVAEATAQAEAGAGAQASQLAIADANQQGSQMALPYAMGGSVLPYGEPEKEKEEIVVRHKYNMGGGVQQLAGGRYLNGMTDGMADDVPSSIGGVQPAALSDGEFVIPADVVSHLGNGSSNAGAKVLDDMMSNVRKERTGNPEQGKQINPKQVMAQGGIAGFANGGLSSLVNSKGPVRNFSGADVGTETGSESSLSNWAGSEVVDALGDAGGLRDKEYEAYDGPLTAGESDLQSDAFEAASDIDTSGFGDLDEEGVQDLMNPYMDAALDPQIRAEQERAAIQRRDNAARMAQAGSFGGSRQAILDSMGQRDSAQTQADIRARGYSDAFTQARDQFGKDRQFGLDALQKQADLGGTQREIEAEGIAADKAQFDEERLYPYKNLSWYMSLLSGLPLEAQNSNYAEASEFSKYMETLDYLGEEGGLDFLKTQAAVDYDTVAGDTLANLASKYGMSEADLLMLNPTITDPTAAIADGTTIKVNRGKI